MERSKFESLQRTIEEQNKKIETYKTKLKDVVQAYKDLAKEKEALEATVTALKSIQPPTQHNQTTESISNETSESYDKTLMNDSTNEKTNDCEINEDSEPKVVSNLDSNITQQIDVLTSSLLVVTQQKSKLEANFIAERKQNKQVLDDKEKEINSLLEQIQQLDINNAEWRNKLRQQQQEHDKQQNDCSLMIKELQTMIGTQRVEIMKFESQVEDMKLALEEKQKTSSAHLNVIENKERSLKLELQEANKKLEEANIKLSESSPQIAVLQQKLAHAEDREMKQKKIDEKKIEELEMKIKEMAKLYETRVTSLEQSICQLSESLGDVEKERRNEQSLIQKLKDRNLHLDQENIALINLSKTAPKVLEANDDSITTEELFSKVLTLIENLKYRQCDLSLLQDLLSNDQDMHQKCKQQFEQLQEDYERYKLRAQSVLKNKSKESNADHEIINLKRQISELKEKQLKLIATIDTKELELSKKENAQLSLISSLEGKHKNEITQINAEHKQKILDLELELRKQRDRTISMLADKDQEINELKFLISSQGSSRNGSKDLRLPSYNETSYSNKSITTFETFKSQIVDNSEVGASSATNEESADFNSNLAIKELFSRSPFISGNETTSNLLHYAQEKAKLEVEISNLRKQKHTIEQSARETFCTLTLEKQECERKLSEMTEFVKKLERDSNRENANLEYLKNVVYQYMICRDGSSRHRIFNAISTILQFSPSEKQVVLSKKGWSSYQHNTHI